MSALRTRRGLAQRRRLCTIVCTSLAGAYVVFALSAFLFCACSLTKNERTEWWGGSALSSFAVEAYDTTADRWLSGTFRCTPVAIAGVAGSERRMRAVGAIK